MNTRKLSSFFVLAALAISCSHGDATTSSTSASAGAASIERVAAAPSSPGAHAARASDEDDAPAPREPFTDGERAFRSAKETLLAHYYESGITEDELYRAAVEGMLSRLEPKMHKWNKLLSPSQLADLEADTRGELVGIGVRIHFDPETGYADVLGVIPGSPAERAKLAPGDKILSVDGKLYKGKREQEVVADIRGKAGDAVTLALLRDDKVISIPVKRETVQIDDVGGAMLPGSVGYVAIRSFNAKTPAALKEALASLASARAMILDLRCNGGGLFDEAVASASLFLPAGTPVVKVQKRGEAAETIPAKGDRVVADMPLAVLVNEETSSGAEFVAAALAEGRGAQIVGTRTFGKWSVQKIDKLSNGYAMKYTVSLFQTPSGKSYGGIGLSPDVEVTMDEKASLKAQAIADVTKRVADDVQLRSALGIVRGHP